MFIILRENVGSLFQQPLGICRITWSSCFAVPAVRLFIKQRGCVQSAYVSYSHYTRGAHKSLARPDWKNSCKVAIFRPTRRSLLPRRPGWTDNLLNCFWVACKF